MPTKSNMSLVKTIISVTIAVILALVFTRVALWLVFGVFQILFSTMIIIFAIMLAVPLYLIIRKKILK